MALAKTRVLIVEDEQMLAEMYATKFSMEGYTAETANDGQAGLEAAKRATPDIILLDIIMPKLDGFSTLQQLKADPALKNVPVVLLTNLGQDDDIKKGKQLGADDYFVKANHSPQEVVEKVRTILKR
ncbi:MAG: response regulator [Candidatus Kerfeldbacteria bacterium]|nr:response regulator [Candidatus Kerfeldbacteria bacterium]